MEFEPKMPPVALVEPQASVDYRRTREMTIDEILLENRVVFLTGEINYASATRVMMQMLYLEDQKKGQPINFYINCFGGAVDDTLAIYDTMRFISLKWPPTASGELIPVRPSCWPRAMRANVTSCPMPK